MLKRIALILTTLVLLAACTPAEKTADPTGLPSVEATPASTQAAFPLSLVDGLGRTVILEAPARRVVSLAPSNTEILFAIGAGSQVVGRDLFSDFPADAAALADIGGSMGEYNLEAIAALQPDLVLAGGINTPELVASLEQLMLTVYFLPNPSTLEEMYTNLETVGRLTGTETGAIDLVGSLKERVAVVDAAILPISARPTVYYEIDASNPSSPYTYGPGSFGDQLIERSGGFNIGSQLQGEWAIISLEQLVSADPAIVFLGDAAWGETPEKFAERPGMGSLAAVLSGQVYPFDDNLVSRPGPRLVDGLEELVKLVHPGVLR